jgi:hypothetical protein
MNCSKFGSSGNRLQFLREPPQSSGAVPRAKMFPFTLTIQYPFWPGIAVILPLPPAHPRSGAPSTQRVPPISSRWTQNPPPGAAVMLVRSAPEAWARTGISPGIASVSRLSKATGRPVAMLRILLETTPPKVINMLPWHLSSREFSLRYRRRQYFGGRSVLWPGLARTSPSRDWRKKAKRDLLTQVATVGLQMLRMRFSRRRAAHGTAREEC